MSILGSTLIILGSFFSLVAAIGVVKFSTYYMKLHAASKASTLGVIFVFMGIAIEHDTYLTTLKTSTVILFLLITVPAGTHALVKAYREDNKD
ncbi:monovalent cation/H(+) antiporter subunit G [bacterium]|nr:monovalent cation/H(+) antiporter subunit G [bacterium]